MFVKRIALLLAVILCLSFGFAAYADEAQPISIIPYDELPKPLDGQHHYLLLCVDQWTGRPENLGNTDGIVMVTLDTRTQRVMLTSFSRDMLIQRADGKPGRITYVAKTSGPEELCKVISTHFGVKVEKYLLFDMSQISNIVDHLGGVELTIDDAEANYLKRYAISPTATKPRINRQGTYLFNGHASVIYMRIRKLAGGEFMRTQRVRTVLSTLADKCRNITFDQALSLVSAISENTCLTNMTLNELMEAMEYALTLRGVTVEELQMPLDSAAHNINYAGMAVREVDFATCREAVADYMDKSFLVAD